MAVKYPGILVALLALSWPAAARADGPRTGDVIIETRDGAMFRGRVVERIPGKYVSLQLASGETRRIPESAVARETDVAAGPTGAEGRTATPAGPTRTVHVEFVTDVDRAELQQLDNDSWVAACSGPCSAQMSAAALYRIGGAGIEKSTSFRLPLDRTNVHVDASVGTTTTTGWGVILVGGGAGLALFVGLPLLALGVIANSTDATHPLHGSGPGLSTAGGLIIIGGLAAAIAGGVMIVNNGTKVTVARAPSATRFVGASGRSPLLGWTF